MEQVKSTQPQVNALVNELTQKRITHLFKHFLEIIEDVKTEHKQMLTKLKDKVPEDLLKTADYLTPEKAEYIRKKILDSGNECSRDIASLLTAFDFYYNEERLKALSYRKTVKKVVGSIISE